MRPRRRRPAAALLVPLLALAGTAPLAHAKIACTAGVLGKTCPDHAPVCCFDDYGIPSGCCRAGTACDTRRHECIVDESSEPTAPLTDTTSRFNLSVADVLSAVLVSVACFGGWLAWWLRRRVLRRRGIAPDSGPEYHTVPQELLPEPEDSGDEGAAGEPEGAATDSEDDDAASEGNSPRAPRGGAPEPEAAPLPPPEEVAEQLTCKVCFAARVDCVLLDCGHACACYNCASHLKSCPYCRKVIRKRKRTYTC
eukprot:TRINITY_DN70121_c0_g1_i1.p3 TRINITY_DN70121_c0_g1~~TRINITY_DN70121_c0_g1_i1.p3  ORF type:complete len:278 (+),score=93.34 TRINITY_DN70121_c0_g1_i1:76-834(+)